MRLAEHIVDMLLDDESGKYTVDVRPYPHLYQPKGSKGSTGLDVYGSCPACEREHYGEGRYQHDIKAYDLSHGTCLRHAIEAYMGIPGMTREKAMEKLAGKQFATDWQEAAQGGAAMPPKTSGSTPPKADFWPSM